MLFEYRGHCNERLPNESIVLRYIRIVHSFLWKIMENLPEFELRQWPQGTFRKWFHGNGNDSLDGFGENV